MVNVRIPFKFMRSITLRSYADGSYVDGAWAEGAVTEQVIQAVVQPLSEAEYRRLPQGYSGRLGWQVYTSRDLVLGTDGTIKPDEIQVDGIWFKMVAKDPWISNGYSSGSFVEIKA